MNKIETGEILALYDDNFHYLFNGTKGKYYVGKLSEIGNTNIGKNFTNQLIPRFEAISIFKNSGGKYKLIGLDFSKDNSIPFLFFINTETGELIEVSLDQKDRNFNNNLIGDYYDLSLIPYFKGFNFKANIPANKTNENVEVLLLNKREEEHYIALYNNQTILLTTPDNIQSYMGETILIEIYIKFLGKNIQYGNQFYPGKKEDFIFNTNDGVNKFISNNNSDVVLINDGYINNNNTGLSIKVEYYPVVFCDINTFQESKTANVGYQLLQSNMDGSFLFRDVNNSTLFICYFKPKISLMDKLGSIFTFNFQNYYFLNSIADIIKTNKEDYYQLTEIISDSTIKIFTKNNIQYAIDTRRFNISDSSLGVYFDLKLKSYIWGTIYDAN